MARPQGNTDRKKPTANSNTSIIRAIQLPMLRDRLGLVGTAFSRGGVPISCFTDSCSSFIHVSPHASCIRSPVHLSWRSTCERDDLFFLSITREADSESPGGFTRFFIQI